MHAIMMLADQPHGPWLVGVGGGGGQQDLCALRHKGLMITKFGTEWGN